MSILGWIFNTMNDDDYDNGADWAETLIDVDAEVVPSQVERMADDFGKDYDSFYNGFRDVWNSQPELQQPSWWDRLCGRG